MLLLIFEESTQLIFKSFVERARVASTWEVRVVIGEGVAVLSGVVFEPTLWRVDAVEVVGSVDGIVGLFEGALAVPSVAGVVLGPERVVDGECELLFPKLPMGRFGIGGCCGHPPEVWHDVLVTEKRLPVGRVVGSDDGGVVLSA